ncbi:MAG: IMPACT family protein [Fermentimonas sp.]|nr:IMPACT family protein [Fermentimonas sp.]MDD4008490.1 IMPACT family protein [Fermentimonas sp.]MDD4697989.1 IMPACT family protein [Fermentimonas sp.]
MDDSYKTVSGPSEGYINEKKSKFLSFLFPVKSADEAMGILDEYRKKYYNARHVCWAYMIGWEREEFRFNDDGEPSGTAGKPILGQINSSELTDVLILVVRYFGGTLLGTGGLIKAYKEAAADAISNAEIITKTVDDIIVIDFEYIILNDVMRVLKQFEEVQWTQDFKESCRMKLRVRRSLTPQLSEMLSSIYGVVINENK